MYKYFMLCALFLIFKLHWQILIELRYKLLKINYLWSKLSSFRFAAKKLKNSSYCCWLIPSASNSEALPVGIYFGWDLMFTRNELQLSANFFDNLNFLLTSATVTQFGTIKWFSEFSSSEVFFRISQLLHFIEIFDNEFCLIEIVFVEICGPWK